MSESHDGSQGAGGRRAPAWRRYLAGLRAYVETPEFLGLALAAVLLLGASLRLTGVNWDDQTHLHPDERFLTDVTSRLGWPSSLGEYFDTATSPLNPHNQDVGMFVYGTLPIFITKGIGILVDQSNYWQIHLVGRVVSACYDLIVVALVFFLGRRLYGRWVGLLASFLMACAVLSIQHSHFYTVETFTTLLVTLAFFFTVRVVQGGGWRDWALTGATFGMAVAGKISVATYVLIIGVAALMRARREPVALAAAATGGTAPLWQRDLGRFSISMRTDGDPEKAARRAAFVRGLARAGLGLGLAGLVALVAFRVTQPYAFTGPSPFSLRISQTWLQNDVLSARGLVNGSVDFPPSHQWTDREPIWFAWRNMVLWGMGLPLGLAAWLGWLVAWVELVRKRKLEHLLLLLWVTMTFLYQSVQFVKSIRYFLPIYPLLVILAAYFVVWLWRQAQGLAARARESSPTPSPEPLPGAKRRGGGGASPEPLPAAKRRGSGGASTGDVDGAVFGAGGGSRTAPARAPAGLRRWAPAMAAAVGVVVLGGTFLYAEAFTNIYRRPLSRVEASRWVYDNIPAGASITWEKWDDIVPQNIDGKDAGSTYNLVATDPYWEDSPEKREAMFQWLDEADYIILSSNRVYDSVVRLPERFPLTIAYYKYLFSGELGFDTIKVFTSYPNLGPLQFVDDTADEAFSVYDHPKVIILKKTERYSSERARALLGDIEVDRLVRLSPLASMASHHALMLTSVEQLVQKAGGTWRAMFNPADLPNRLPVVAWLVVLELLALSAFPIAFVAFRRARDRGYIFAKALGILVLAYLAWLGASLHVVPYTRAAIAGFALALVAVATAVAWRQRDAMRAFLGRSWRRLLFEEGLFLALFGAFLLVRLGNPDLWHPVMGGEKPMDFAYLNAIIKSTWFPPYDPWFAGGYINYYYFGQVIVATLIKLGAIVPAVAYNLALPTLFALTAAGGYAVVDALLAEPDARDDRVLDRAARFGLFGALLIGVLGNLGQVRLLLQGLQQASKLSFQSTIPGLEGLVESAAGLYQVVLGGASLNFRPEWWYWNASRVMGAGEINEFPFFSFLYADLHAHLIALPFGLLALGLIVSLLRGRPKESGLALQGAGSAAGLRRWAAGVDWSEWLTLGLLALTLGELRANNTWDYPTYLLLALGGLTLAHVLRPEGIAWRALWGVVSRGVALVVASTALFLPFLSRYGAAYTSLELWKGPRTSPGDYAVIHGVFLLILTSYAVSRALGHQARGALARTVRLSLGRPLQAGRFSRLAGALVAPTAGYQLGWLGVVAVLGASTLSFLAGWWVPGLTLPLILLGLALVLRRDLSVAERFAAMLFTLGLALTLAVEVVVLKGDIGRMNTVFKFYLQVWVLWGVAAAVGLSVLTRRWLRWPAGMRRLWQAGLACLLFGAALYPLTATWAKINDRFDRGTGATLDGTAYAETAVYHDQGQPLDLAGDMVAIEWLQQNVDGSPVILEGNAPLYRWGSRVSIYTGLPTVIGWDWHEKQQRAVVPVDVVGWRLNDVSTLYNGTDRAETARLLALYDISYVYVGQLERVYYAPDGLGKFDLWGDLFRPVYRQGSVTIYEVRKESLGGLSSLPFEATRVGSSDFSRLGGGGQGGGLARRRGPEVNTAQIRRCRGEASGNTIHSGQCQTSPRCFTLVAAPGAGRGEAFGCGLPGPGDGWPAKCITPTLLACDSNGIGATALTTSLTADSPASGVGRSWGGQGAEAPTTSLAVRSSGLSRVPGSGSAGGQGAEAPTTSLVRNSDFGRILIDRLVEGQGAEAPTTNEDVVDDRGWNPLANAGPLAAALSWWLALAVIGWTAWPLVLGACRGLPDRGYLVAKAVGWLLVGYLAWLGASTRLLANRVTHIYAVLALVAAAGAWAAYRRRRELGALLRARRGLLVAEEALFSGAFAALVLVRLANPDLWQPWFGGEKMMELAYLNAIIKSAHMPPYDPYFAGAHINYYYYGLYLVNVLVKLTGVVSEVAFNLAVPTFFALTVGTAFSFGHALSARLRGRRWLVGGLAAAGGVAVAANLTVLVQWLASMVSAGGAVPRPEMGVEALAPLAAGVGRWLSGQATLQPFDYWYAATRIIPFTINEFPFFSYLFADLHPHMMAIPFTIAGLVLVAGRFLAYASRQSQLSASRQPGYTLRTRPARMFLRDPCPGVEPSERGAVPSQTPLHSGASGPAECPVVKRARTGPGALRWTASEATSLVLLALVLGALGPMNTWDVPTYLGLAMVVLVWLGVERGRVWRGVAEALGVAALAFTLYLPFYAHYAAPRPAPKLLLAHTGLRYFLAIWGLWLVALYSWLVARWWGGRRGAGHFWRLRYGQARGRRLLAALRRRPSGEARLRALIVSAGLVLALAVLLADEPVAALLLPLAALAAALALRRDAPRAERLAALVAAWGCLILSGIEFVYLADFLRGSEWQRMNTVFKFGMQAWVLLALATTVGLASLLVGARQREAKARAGLVRAGEVHSGRPQQIYRWRLGSSATRDAEPPAELERRSEVRSGRLREVRTWRVGWTAALAGLAVISLAYVPLGVAARVSERFPGGRAPTWTLDGLAYMQSGVYHWPDEDHAIVLRYDYQAIQWLLENVRGAPVIAEAPLGYYREGGMRVSSYTGLPTLVGMHQNEQRPMEVVAERTAQAEKLYRAGVQATPDLLRQLGVEYVYFGQLEQIVYGDASRDKFDELVRQGTLEVAYSNPKVVIYHVVPGA